MPNGNLSQIFSGDDDSNVTRIDPPDDPATAHDESDPSRRNGSASPSEAESSSSGDEEQSGGDAPVSPWLERSRYERNQKTLLRRQNFWLRLLAGVFAISTVVAMGVNLWVSSSNQVEPVYIPVDRSSKEVLEPQRVDQIQTLSEPMVKNQLREVIRGLRTVYADFRATKQSYQNAWNHIQPGSEAEVFLKETYNITSEDDITSPTALTGSVQRQVSELEIVPIEGSDSYSLQWVEREARLDSETLVENVYAGSVSIIRLEQSDIEALRQNPTGLYIKGLSWQETERKVLQSPASSPTEASSTEGSSTQGSSSEASSSEASSTGSPSTGNSPG